jgi:hypothetical protein
MTIYLALVAAPAAAIIGWIAGMYTLRRSQRWCPRCGDTLRCPMCATETVTRP